MARNTFCIQMHEDLTRTARQPSVTGTYVQCCSRLKNVDSLAIYIYCLLYTMYKKWIFTLNLNLIKNVSNLQKIDPVVVAHVLLKSILL